MQDVNMSSNDVNQEVFMQMIRISDPGLKDGGLKICISRFKRVLEWERDSLYQ